MRTIDNPYAAALDGLDLPGPVAAFFGFCRAREAVRIRRESGSPPPWTDDPILQRGRFLNVFREDDRGTKAVLRFARPTSDDFPALLQALLFARWCNRAATLDRLTAAELADARRLRHKLQALPDQPWCNVTAYPVDRATIDGVVHSRLDTATRMFADLRHRLAQAVLGADRDIVRATNAINDVLGLANDFPIFMAVVDIARSCSATSSFCRPAAVSPRRHRNWHAHAHVYNGLGGPMAHSRRTQILMEPTEHAALERIAASKRVSVAELFRRAVRAQYLDRRLEAEACVHNLTCMALDLPEWEELARELDEGRDAGVH